MNYVLVEWEADNSLSVVPVSRLLSRDGNRVSQKWGKQVYAGNILKESGECLCRN